VRTRLTLRPGQRGTKQLVARYGKQLLYVRYRYDAKRQKRYKTVELIIDESDWVPPPPPPESIVAVRVAFREAEIRRNIRSAGGTWDQDHRVWLLRYEEAVLLDLVDRIVNIDE
jgi:hypothetical protein